MKKLLILLLMLILSISLVSCAKAIFVGSKLPEDAPQYLKDAYSDLTKEGIKVHYDPEILKEIPLPQKPYSAFPPVEIPNNWVVGELEWSMHKEPASPYGIISLADFYDDYVLTQVPKEDYIPPSSRPNATKPILKLYKRKNAGEAFPKKLTESDYMLVKVLDKAPEDEPYPQNQGAELSDRFVVWQASSNESSTNWQVWGYDINKDKEFLICSYKDHAIPQDRGDFYNFPVYTLVAEKNLLLMNFVEQDSDGKLRGKIFTYDLASEKILKVISSEKYAYSRPLLSDTYIFASRLDLYQNINDRPQYTASSIVRINLNTGEEKVIIPNGNFYVTSAYQEKVCLVPLLLDYQFHDIWVLNTKINEMDCYMKVPIENGAMPFATLTKDGILYASGQGNQTPYYFYSFNKRKAFYTGPLLTSPDNLERFLIMKTNFDNYYPPPSFDYEGKKRRLEGYNTFLIIKPE